MLVRACVSFLPNREEGFAHTWSLLGDAFNIFFRISKSFTQKISLGEYSFMYSYIRFYSYIRPIFVPESNNECRLVIRYS